MTDQPRYPTFPDLPEIVVTPGTCGGDPRLIGHRIPIWCILHRWLEGRTIESVSEDYPGTTAEQVRQAVLYAMRVLGNDLCDWILVKGDCEGD